RRPRAAEPEARRRVARRAIRMQIAPAHPRRLDRQHHLAGRRRGIREIAHVELTATEEHDALHDWPPLGRGTLVGFPSGFPSGASNSIATRYTQPVFEG